MCSEFLARVRPRLAAVQALGRRRRRIPLAPAHVLAGAHPHRLGLTGSGDAPYGVRALRIEDRPPRRAAFSVFHTPPDPTATYHVPAAWVNDDVLMRPDMMAAHVASSSRKQLGGDERRRRADFAAAARFGLVCRAAACWAFDQLAARLAGAPGASVRKRSTGGLKTASTAWFQARTGLEITCRPARAFSLRLRGRASYRGCDAGAARLSRARADSM